MSTSFSSDDAARKTTVSLRSFLPEAVFVGAEDISVRRCVNRAENCRPGDVFVPQHTAASDEHDKADLAIRRGAVAIIAERILPVSVPQCLVENTQEVYAKVCQALVDNPSQRMLTIGVVGTHGKTTTSLFVAAMLKHVGGAVAYYTSLGASDSTFCDRECTRPPAARKLANWLKNSEKAGAPAAIVELTPSMLKNHVAAGVEFDLIILTGLRPSQQRGCPGIREYKLLLGRMLGQMKAHGMVLYNADDANATAWAAETDASCVSFGLDAAEHVRAKRLSRSGAEQQLLAMAGNLLMPLTVKMPGDHNARAALAAVATAWMFDFSVPDAIAGTESLTTIPGRLQRVSQAVDVPTFIDSGDTPDRVAVALHALRQHNQGPATVVVDLTSQLEPRWRQRLGEVLEKEAHRVVLTGSDLGPSATQSIAMDVLGGFKSPGRVQVIPDREAAIKWAVDNKDDGCILLLGKGATQWPDREGKLLDDHAVAVEAVKEKNRVAPCPALGIFPPPDTNSFFPIDS